MESEIFFILRSHTPGLLAMGPCTIVVVDTLECGLSQQSRVAEGSNT